MKEFEKFKSVEYIDKTIDFYVDKSRGIDDVVIPLDELVKLLGYLDEAEIMQALLNQRYLLEYIYQGRIDDEIKFFVGRYAIDYLAYNHYLDPDFKDLGDLVFRVHYMLTIFDSLKKEYEYIKENIIDKSVYMNFMDGEEDEDYDN
ncbi:MAG: hypothetical protein ACOCV1_08040 [Bacillota bacterium]